MSVTCYVAVHSVVSIELLGGLTTCGMLNPSPLSMYRFSA